MTRAVIAAVAGLSLFSASIRQAWKDGRTPGLRVPR